MAQSTPDLPDLDSAMSALKERRNSLLGGGAVVILVVVLFLFVQNQLKSARVGPWQTALADGLPWTATAEELAQRAEEVRGTDVEPFLRYWQIVVMYEDGKEAEALNLLASFQKDFPDHYLNTRAHVVVEGPEEQLLTPTQRLAAEHARLQAWTQQHPLPPDNPAPEGGQTVTLKTAKGDIEFTLYATRSRECAEAFVRHAKALEGSLIQNAQEGLWLDIGHEEDGRAVDVETGEDRFPPFTDAPLSHYRGTVAFAQRPLSEAPHEARIRVWLDRSFRDDNSSTVFAKVTKGMDLLEALAKGPRDETIPSRLADPVAITEVVINAPELVTEPAPDQDASGAEDGSEDGDDG